MQLPQDLSVQEFIQSFRAKYDEWKGAVKEICSKHNTVISKFEPFEDGSNLIASISENSIVKIFPPFHRHQWESEWRTLKTLNNQSLSLPIPNLLAHGERDDRWTYVIISKLSGVSLESVWTTLTRENKARLMNQIGKIMAEVHSLPVGDLAVLEPKWCEFIENQRHNFKTRHERLKMPEWFLNEADTLIAEHFQKIPGDKLVLLTGEYTPFNLLVEKTGNDWRLSGMIDFGDTMIGFKEYDFLGPLLFLAEGDSLLVDQLFSSYRYAKPGNSPDLRKRLLVLAILHRYSNLKSQIRIPNWLDRVNSLLELEKLIMPH